jgi:hypothetical protein
MVQGLALVSVTVSAAPGTVRPDQNARLSQLPLAFAAQVMEAISMCFLKCVDNKPAYIRSSYARSVLASKPAALMARSCGGRRQR